MQGTRGSEGTRRLRGLPVAALFCLLATIVFATQFAGTGFGKRPHHSWVSSHALAVMSRATPENGFVGHARTFLNADGSLDYTYFDRAPVLFAALSGALIGLADDLPTKVWIARQVMQVLFVLTMLLAWRLLRRLGASPAATMAAVTLSFSGFMLLYYRGMFDYEAPSLAGMLLLLLAIAGAGQSRAPRRRWLIPATLLALALGRGIPSLVVLGSWFVLEAATVATQRGLTGGERLRVLLRHPATRLLLLGVVWTALLTGYNMAQEMARRGVPLKRQVSTAASGDGWCRKTIQTTTSRILYRRWKAGCCAGTCRWIMKAQGAPIRCCCIRR